MSDDAIRVLQERVKVLEEVVGEIHRASEVFLKNAGYFGDDVDPYDDDNLESYMLTVWQAADEVTNGEES